MGRPSAQNVEDPMMDFRARLVHQQAEAAERRRLDLAEQSSRLKTAEERIRIWERIHEVTLFSQRRSVEQRQFGQFAHRSAVFVGKHV